MQSAPQHSDPSPSVALTNLLFDHPEVKYFNQLYQLSNPAPIFHSLAAKINTSPTPTPIITSQLPLYRFSTTTDTFLDDMRAEQVYFAEVFATSPQPSQSTQLRASESNLPSSSPQPPRTTTSPHQPTTLSNLPSNAFILLQYKHLMTKFWHSIGVIHLQEFHINLDIFFGINCARYIIPSDNYDKGTYSIKFPPETYQRHHFLPSPTHTPDVSPDSTILTDIQQERPSSDPLLNSLQPRSHSQHKVFSFKPCHILSILSHLHATKQMSPILTHYLTYVISIPSFVNLISAIISPHFDFIIPVSLPFSPSPAFFHAIFSTLSLLYDDLLSLLSPFYEILLNQSPLSEALESELPPNTDFEQQLISINKHPFVYAQPSPHNDSELSLLHPNNQQYKTRKLRPHSFLLNTIIDDGSMNVARITNGLK